MLHFNDRVRSRYEDKQMVQLALVMVGIFSIAVGIIMGLTLL